MPFNQLCRPVMGAQTIINNKLGVPGSSGCCVKKSGQTDPLKLIPLIQGIQKQVGHAITDILEFSHSLIPKFCLTKMVLIRFLPTFMFFFFKLWFDFVMAISSHGTFASYLSTT